MKTILEAVWTEVCELIQQGSVPSEPTLQAMFVSLLVGKIPDCIVVCEPHLNIAGEPYAFRPDIVVVLNNDILVFAELKMDLLKCPVWEQDVYKLRTLLKHAQALDIFVDPATGKYGDQRLKIAANCLAVFAAVSRSDCQATRDGLPTEGIPDSQWLHLKFQTKPGIGI